VANGEGFEFGDMNTCGVLLLQIERKYQLFIRRLFQQHSTHTVTPPLGQQLVRQRHHFPWASLRIGLVHLFGEPVPRQFRRLSSRRLL
jgi:hypothetical protein